MVVDNLKFNGRNTIYPKLFLFEKKVNEKRNVYYSSATKKFVVGELTNILLSYVTEKKKGEENLIK